MSGAVRAGLHLEAELAAGLPDAGGREPADGPVLVAGMDEVGRGALAGPVVVGACAAWIPDAGGVPAVRDSKALSDARRRALVPEISAWAAAVCLGEASPAEIDRMGITAALGLAGRRAWAELCTALGQEPVGLILDGRDDWLTRAVADGEAALPVPAPPVPRMVVRAEDQSATVAAASIVAKVGRDDTMIALHAAHPAYGWAGNKGYGAQGHRDALRELGATEHHRRSWNLGLPEDAAPTLFD